MFFSSLLFAFEEEEEEDVHARFKQILKLRDLPLPPSLLCRLLRSPYDVGGGVAGLLSSSLLFLSLRPSFLLPTSRSCLLHVTQRVEWLRARRDFSRCRDTPRLQLRTCSFYILEKVRQRDARIRLLSPVYLSVYLSSYLALFVQLPRTAWPRFFVTEEEEEVPQILLIDAFLITVERRVMCLSFSIRRSV